MVDEPPSGFDIFDSVKWGISIFIGDIYVSTWRAIGETASVVYREIAPFATKYARTSICP